MRTVRLCMKRIITQDKTKHMSFVVPELHHTLPLHPPSTKYRESANRKTATITEQPYRLKVYRMSPISTNTVTARPRTSEDSDGGVPAGRVLNCARYRRARKCPE